MKKSIQAFYGTKPFPCAYLPDRMEAKLATELKDGDAQQWSNMLSRAGFRRSHAICYIPACPDCRACQSVRIPVADFSPSKKMKKTIRLNDGFRPVFLPNVATTEQYALFARYLKTRHSDSEMNAMDFEEYRAMVEDTPVNCQIMETRDGNNVLRGAMVVDVMDDGLSAVYSFFDPDFAKNSLGTFMILNVIEETRRRALPYVYLGYMIKGLSNMAYKEKFKPLEYCDHGVWKQTD